MLEVVVCDLTGQPLDSVELSSVSATASLSSPGEADLTIRASDSLAQYLTPWGGMLVALNEAGDVLWSGVPVKRRGEIGSGRYQIVAREWAHWLQRVAPGKLDDVSYGDYDGATAGYILSNLMGLVPQSETGFVTCPLLAPSAATGSTVYLGEPPESIDRGTVWDIVAPLRDQGIEMRAVTAFESGAYVPRMVVGSPQIGETDVVRLWLGSNVAGAQVEEDGDLMATRWRAKGQGDNFEKFASGTGLLLLDNVKDYGDNFALFDPGDEVAELETRVDALLANTKVPPLSFSDVELPAGAVLNPGDAVSISAPPDLQDVRLTDGYEATGRIESVNITGERTTISLVSPESSSDTLPSRPDFYKQLRDLGATVARLGLKV